MKDLDKKINEYFIGKVVRKDLTQYVKSNAVVPTYVLEYLLGQHCATDDEDIIKNGIEKVKSILTNHFVHRDEAQMIMSQVREKGSYNIIDKISVRLNDRRDRYEANFANLGLNRIPIADVIVNEHKKLLSDGVWCIIGLAYTATDERDRSPWNIESLRPIEISNVSTQEFKEHRDAFSTTEWIDLLMQTIGLNPEEFTYRSKLIQLTRLIPFVENNYNLIELGPKGTGKSHVFSELSPHGILISGGEITQAKLFVNNSTGEIGLVGYWDVVAYDEFAGKTKRVNRGLVDIMKNYMANKSFSRGTNVYNATASMAFVGNTDRSVPYMLKHSDLFEALPKAYYDTAFLDRLHAYVPGWEVDKLRNEMFTDGYGFVVDYLAEILRELRKEDWTNDYAKHFELSSSITTRDKTAIEKTFAGLCKIIFPNKEASRKELQEVFEFAIESRRRVKQQLIKMDETFEAVDFSYQILETGEWVNVKTLEEIQYLDSETIYSEDTIAYEAPSEESEVVKETKPKLGNKYINVLDNQKGISYKNLFGDYFKGAKQIRLIDPYIRYHHQMKNMMELISLIVSYKPIDEVIEFKLTTSNTPEYIAEATERFYGIKANLSTVGVDFDFEFDDSIHDRFIFIDDTWVISLGRGLDIWNKTGGSFDIAEANQLYRSCKSFTMMISSKEEWEKANENIS